LCCWEILRSLVADTNSMLSDVGKRSREVV
jgi:hypothetical protein